MQPKQVGVNVGASLAVAPGVILLKHALHPVIVEHATQALVLSFQY